jgi:hypothetical protein
MCEKMDYSGKKITIIQLLSRHMVDILGSGLGVVERGAMVEMARMTTRAADQQRQA